MGFADEGRGGAGAVGQGGGQGNGEAGVEAGAGGEQGGTAGTEQGGTAGMEQGGTAGTEQGGTAGMEQGGVAGGGQGGVAGGGQGGVAGGGQGGVAGTAGSSGSGGGAEPVDTTPPGPLSTKAGGNYNISTAFSCVQVAGIEPGASAYYELTTNGAEPASPTTSSAKLAANAQLCGINQNGTTKLRLVQYDAAGNRGPVTLHQYVLDTLAPEVCAVSASPDTVAFVDLPLHLKLRAEPGGVGTVEIGGVGTATLKDDGTGGDAKAGDGVYELDYAIPSGADVPNATLTARFTDAAGNPATALVDQQKLFVDRTATQLSGAIVVDTVMTEAASPYVVNANTAIDGSLSIQPGVTLIFKGGSLLTVLGTLTAVGNSAKPIRMYDARLSLDGPKNFKTFDPLTGAYVAGHRLDYVQMADGLLELKAKIFGSSGIGPSGVYMTNSEVKTLAGAPNYSTYGSYIEKSYVHSILNSTSLNETRIVNSYLDEVSLFGNTATELRSNRFGVLSVDFWSAQNVLERCDIGLLRLRNPTTGDVATFHSNNLGVLGLPLSLEVILGDPTSSRVDATGNYWGAATTAQMNQLGTTANISAIKDFFDDVKLTRVDYSGYLSAPVDAGPNWSLPEPPAVDESCESSGGGGGGGSGGTGGTGGSGGTGGAGGSGGTGGTGGSGGTGGTGAGQLLGGCNNVEGKFCTNYSGPSAQKDALQASCSQTQNTWQSSCSTSGLLGTCTFQYGSPALGVTGSTRYYQGGPATAAQLESSCKAGLAGTWTNP